jgi:hypothetical protein
MATRTLGRGARRWIAVAAVAWAVVLVAAATYAVRVGRPTVREQTTIVAAVPYVDRAIGIVASAALGPQTLGPQTVVSVGGYERTQASCDLGTRDGQRYERAVQVFVPPGREPELVDRVAHALPAGFKTSVRHGGSVQGLSADAGFYVRLGGGQVNPGELRFTADTGCRPPGGAPPVAAPADPSGAAGTAVLAALTLIGVPPPPLVEYRVPCAAGGGLTTVAATGPKPANPLPVVGGAVIARDDLLVYVDGDIGIMVRGRGDSVTVTGTGRCQ